MVSAALKPDGIPRRALVMARAKGTIVLSHAIYTEIAQVLARPKFSRVITDVRRSEILEVLTAAALWIAPTETVKDCRDPTDNRYLELAAASRASFIITGDEDLLALNPWRGVRVVRPAEFLKEIDAMIGQADAS